MRGGSALMGAFSGGLIGFVVSALLVGMGGYAWVKKKEAEVRRGWNLVPVIVAAQDIPEDSVVTYDVISQRVVPEQFVTRSVVKPDSAQYIVKQRLLVPVQKGDMLLWSQFATQSQAQGLVAARDLPVGTRLTEADVEPRRMPPELLTPSYITETERTRVVGRTISAAFRKGDPILWTHFPDAPAPVTDAQPQ
jgi:Flp pilus assembly protein CpaB